MPTLTIFNGYAGCTTLVEYHGSAGDVVALTAAIQWGTAKLFADVPLSSLALFPLHTLASQVLGGIWFQGDIIRWHLAEANSNGIVHLLIPQTVIAASGDIMHVSARVVT